MFTNESDSYTESEAYDSTSIVPIHTRSELSSDSDSASDTASVASVTSVNQPLRFPGSLKPSSSVCYVLFSSEEKYIFWGSVVVSQKPLTSYTKLN